jgi:hypothetical protein
MEAAHGRNGIGAQQRVLRAGDNDEQTANISNSDQSISA